MDCLVEDVKQIDKVLTLVQRQLLALIRLAITGMSSSVLDVCEIDWAKLYSEAERQSVVGLCWAGIERLPNGRLPDMDWLMDWLGQAEYIKAQNDVANLDCERITNQFRNAGFRTSIMKGQGNARLYDVNSGPISNLSSFRTSGDIDLWVSGGFDKVNEYVQGVAPTNHINELEIQFESGLETTIEVHYRPLIMRNPITNRRMQRFFQQEAESCFDNGLFTTQRFNIIHQLAHIRLHLFTEGIGLRQIIDYYFVLKAYYNEKKFGDNLLFVIDRLGLRDFAEAMMWIMKAVLGMEDQFLLCAPNQKDGMFFLDDVMKAGNFGHSLEKRGMLYRVFIRNLRLWRFDHWDWFWGPLWRLYHNFWKIIHGYV